MFYINSETLEYPLTENQIKQLTPQISYRENFVPIEPFRKVELVTPPTYDPVNEGRRELTPELVEGVFYQRFEVYSLSEEEISVNVKNKEDHDQMVVNSKIEALWQSADSYTRSFISGVAVGILTIGVMQQKPKALAVSNWSSSIWTEYYRRKELITATSEVDFDFSSFGPIPFSVPELQIEANI